MSESSVLLNLPTIGVVLLERNMVEGLDAEAGSQNWLRICVNCIP